MFKIVHISPTVNKLSLLTAISLKMFFSLDVKKLRLGCYKQIGNPYSKLISFAELYCHIIYQKEFHNRTKPGTLKQ